MKKILLKNLILKFLIAAIFTSYSANAKDFDYKTALGFGFGQGSINGSFLSNTVYSNNSGTNSDYNFSTNISSKKEIIDLRIESRFKLFDKFILSPSIRIPLNNNKLENNYSLNSSYKDSDEENSENISLKQNFSADYFLDLKLGYFLNKKTNIYASAGYMQSKYDIEYLFNDSCASSSNYCANSSSSAFSSGNYSDSYKDKLTIYSIGVETEIYQNILLDVSYSFSEESSRDFSVSGVDSYGYNYTNNYSLNNEYRLLSLALKYLF